MPLNEAEKKLLEYRTRKERLERRNRFQAKLKSMFPTLWGKKHEKSEENESNASLLSTSTLTSTSSIPETAEITEEILDFEVSPQPATVFDYIQYFLWFILWLTVYAIFIKLEFGIIYLIVSALVGMYVNTRTGPKRKNEISAYSVFNKNCEKIDGTLDGEKMAQQIMYGGFAR